MNDSDEELGDTVCQLCRGYFDGSDVSQWTPIGTFSLCFECQLQIGEDDFYQLLTKTLEDSGLSHVQNAVFWPSEAYYEQTMEMTIRRLTTIDDASNLQRMILNKTSMLAYRLSPFAEAMSRTDWLTPDDDSGKATALKFVRCPFVFIPQFESEKHFQNLIFWDSRSYFEELLGRVGVRTRVLDWGKLTIATGMRVKPGNLGDVCNEAITVDTVRQIHEVHQVCVDEGMPPTPPPFPTRGGGSVGKGSIGKGGQDRSDPEPRVRFDEATQMPWPGQPGYATVPPVARPVPPPVRPPTPVQSDPGPRWGDSAPGWGDVPSVWAQPQANPRRDPAPGKCGKASETPDITREMEGLDFVENFVTHFAPSKMLTVHMADDDPQWIHTAPMEMAEPPTTTTGPGCTLRVRAEQDAGGS